MPKEEKNTTSNDSQAFYTHVEKGNKLVIPKQNHLHTEDINIFMQEIFGNRECIVLHEVMSDIIHLDVLAYLPNSKDNRTILCTSGMSDLPMKLPFKMRFKYKYLERAELLIFLPGDWDIKNDSEEWYWPIRLLKNLARLPHVFHTWVGWGHSIPSGSDNAPYAPDTKLNGAVLYGLQNQNNFLIASDKKRINFYTVVPVYQEEMDYKLQFGADGLLDQLDRIDFSTTINIHRKNACSPSRM